MVLTDSGSLHNFIDIRTEKQYNMFVNPTSNFQVAILGDKTTSCDGKCHKLQLSINKLLVIVTNVNYGN